MRQSIVLLWALLLCSIASFAQDLSTSVYFEPTKFELQTAEQETLNNFLANLPANVAAYDILLVGHTDNVGDAAYNKRLSEKRCKTIKDYLLTQGITVPQLAYEGKGYDAPIASNNTLEGKAKNRRVELVMMPRGSFSDAPVQVPKEKLVFDAEDGIAYTYERSGTEIRIPANALVYEDGSPVEGEVEVTYREFRDAADFIATDIPMMFDHQHQFESAGVFGLNASQGGRNVFVKEGEYIDVEFVMTSDSVENVSFFEYENEQWTALGALDRTSQENTFDVKSTCKQILRYPMPPITGDSLGIFLNAMRTGYYLSKEADMEQFYRIGFLTMDERFHDARYLGNNYLHYNIKKIDWKKVGNARAAARIQFEYNDDYIQVDEKYQEIRLKEGLWVQFRKDLKGGGVQDFPELKELANRKWMVLPKGKYKPSARAKALRTMAEKYMDIRVNYLGDHNFQFVLKREGFVFDTLVVQPVFKQGERRNKENACKMLIANYKESLNKRSSKFDERIKFYEKNWKYFLAFSATIMPRAEKCKSISRWLKSFPKKRTLMERLYYPYTGLDDNVAELKPLLNRAIAGTPIPLDNPPFPPSQRLAQRLSINGFGTFNCDAIQRLGPERITVEANFITATGEKIDAKVINVIDYNINSILRLYNAKSVSFNPARKTCMSVIDFYGDVYIVEADAIAAYDYKSGKTVYDFEVQKVITKSVEDIRDAIAAN